MERSILSDEGSALTLQLYDEEAHEQHRQQKQVGEVLYPVTLPDFMKDEF
ncbi:MAG: hypothetical protein WC343_08715 [Bacilli bacterium]